MRKFLPRPVTLWLHALAIAVGFGASTRGDPSLDSTARPEPAVSPPRLSAGGEWLNPASALVDVPGLTTLRREVRRFDFEEGAEGLVTFPGDFYRYLASDQGFPAFGAMRLSQASPAAGDWSFEFNLQGGSMAARIAPGVIPVLPLGDYVVNALVRTVDLHNARARVVAWFTDHRGEPIIESRVQSDLLRTNGNWEQVTVPIHGEFARATHLVVELQVIQPRQFGTQAWRAGKPQHDDVSGMAWFDELTIWQLPRIELSTASAGNVILPSEPQMLRVLVADLTPEPLTAQLQVRDLRDRNVFEHEFPAPRGERAQDVDLGRLQAGWYRADLRISNQRGIVGESALELVILPALDRRQATRPAMFGATIGPLPARYMRQVPDLLRRLGAGAARISLNHETIVDSVSVDLPPELRQAVDEMLNEKVQLTFVLERLPEHIAAALDSAPTQILQLLARDPSAWQPYLERALISFGQQVRRWQAGATRSSDPFWLTDLDATYHRAVASLGTLVPGPLVSVPWSAEQMLDERSRIAGYTMTVPYEVSPESIAEYATTWPRGNEPEVSVNFDLLPVRDFGERQRATDLALRALHGWRAGLPRMTIDAPWTLTGERRPQFMPEPSFAVWSTLSHQLDRRRFVGELPLGPGMTCWILEGAQPTDAALVAWNQSAPPEQAIIRALLADGPVEVVDLFGNHTTVPIGDGEHVIPLGDQPIFVEGINLSLTRFIAGFAIRPGFVPAIHRVHELNVVITNPWDVVISGRVRLLSSEGWQISPRTQDFTIRPGAQTRLPINVVFDGSILAGAKQIEGNIELTAEHKYQLRLRASLEVGLENVQVTPTWSLARNAENGELDLIVTQYITNSGDQTLQLDAFLSAPGISQRRRPIAGLAPGETVARVFQIQDGAALLSGRRIRLGVTDRDGAARLNQALDIPALPLDPLASAPQAAQ
jgi:hypothetical protein